MRLALAAAATLGMTGALAMPIVAVAPDDRQGSIPVAIDAINDPSFFNGAVLVDEYAPLAVFEGTGRQVAIDGRPVSMLQQDPATGQLPGGNGAAAAGPGQSSGPEGAPLLAGSVGRLGVLPGDLQLMHPVNTRRISSPYGWRKNPTGPGHQIHIGQDYPLACGSPVYAAEAGRVIVSGWRGRSGNRVTLDHGNNVHTGYSHNSRLLVSVGEQVAQGQLIALVGTTGNSTGCHLHFEVIINGRWHDPRNYLPLIPGQANAIVDSRRLTVKSNERPARNEETRTERPQPQPDPDVVTPKDDTPVVPKPTPSPKPTPVKSKSSSPTPAPTSKASPSPKPTAETKSPTKSPAPSTASPKPQSPAPSPTPTQTKSEPKPSPTPTESKTAPAPSPSPTESKPAPVTETTAPASPTPTVKETVAEKPRQAETTAPAEAEPETVKMETKKIIATEKEAATAPATESAAADAGEDEVALAGTETGIEPARETESAEQ